MTIRIERAQPSDGTAITELLDEAAGWQAELGSPMWTGGQFVDEVSDAIRERTMHVARLDGDVVGCFLLDRSGPRMERWLRAHDRSADDGVAVGRVAVARRFAGRAIGMQLLAAALERARADGFGRLWLECPAENERLRRYYAAAGFSHIGDNDEPGPNGEPWISSVFERSTRLSPG